MPVRLQNGVVIKALVDTGATNSSVSPKVIYGDLKDEDIKLRPLRTTITVADGGTLGANEVAQIKVAVAENFPVEHTFCVVKFAGQDMILGYDFMKDNNVIIDVKEKSFTMRENSVSDGNLIENEIEHDKPTTDKEEQDDGGLENEYERIRKIIWEPNQDPRRCVCAGEDLTIPVNTAVTVPGCLDGNWGDVEGPLIIQGVDRLTEKQAVRLAHGIVNAEPVVPLRVINLSDEDQTLRKGTVLAEYDEAVIWSDMDLPGQEIEEELDKSERLFGEMISRSTTGLDPEEIKEAETFLHSNKQKNFILHSNDLGHTTLTPHKIDTGDSRPIRQGPRRLPLAKRQVADREVKRMLDMGVIEPSTSPWSSPIVLASKKGGDVRFCIDFRKVNAVTKKDSFPLPRIDDSLNKLQGSSWFSTMDLASGYWQVAMDEEDAEKTAFVVEDGLYQFKVLPFGLCNAGATFQRLMQLTLSGLSWEQVLVYIDDLIVHSQTFSEHLKHLKQVFEKLAAAGLKMAPKKCTFFRREVTFLGHIVSEKGVQTDPSKTSAVAEWPIPRKLKEVQAFLGLCGYYRKFIKGFSAIAQPLYRLTQKDQKFVWDIDCQEAFDTLKAAMTSTPVLAYPRSDGPFILDTDASNYAVGAVLSQVQDGKEHVILFFSKSLSRAEKNYCVTRRELLAVVLGIQHCHHYLLGNHFKVRSDHGSLRWLLNFKNPEGQTARWLSILGKYDFEVEYRPGAKHLNSDGLSRRPCAEECKKCDRAEKVDESHRVRAIHLEDSTQQETDGSWLESVTAEELAEAQNQDETLREVRNWLTKGSRPSWKEVKATTRELRAIWHAWDNLRLRQNILFHVSGSGEEVVDDRQAVAPKDIRHRIFYLLHNLKLGGHQGVARTAALVKQRFWWPHLLEDVQRWVQECQACQARKKGVHRPFPLQQEIADHPMERVGMDILSFTSETDSGKVCALVVCDYFSKYVWAIALDNHKATTVADALVHEVFLKAGLPTTIHSDQGKEFMGEVMSQLSQLLQIARTRTCPYRPQSDGLVERMNRTCLDMLAKLCDGNPADWDQHLPFVVAAYNATPHASSGCSPNLLMFNRETTLPVDLIFQVPRPMRHPTCPNAYVEWVRDQVEVNFKFVRAELNKAAIRQKKCYDEKTCHRKFEVGQFVWRYYPPLQSQDKLNPRNIGPYKILEDMGHGVYRIGRSAGSRPICVHVDHLKRHFGNTNAKDWPSTGEPANNQTEPEDRQAPEIDNESGDNNDIGDTEVIGRKGRRSRMPPKYRDYVLYQ